MPETAQTRLNRITQIVAELTRDGSESVEALAEVFGVSEGQILEDLEALGDATDNPKGALGNFRFELVKGRVSAVSENAFQRPLILNREEAIALGIALGSDPDASEALERLVPHPVAVSERIALGPDSEAGNITALALTARQLRRCLEIDYATAGEEHATTRVVHPHLVVAKDGVDYVVAWCEERNARRIFRTERILAAKLLDREFTLRDELLKPVSEEELDHRGGAGETVKVRYAAAIARWIAERHPDGSENEDGSFVVEFTVWNPDWLVRHVLQYGVEAEVLGPPSYRRMMKRAVAPVERLI